MHVNGNIQSYLVPHVNFVFSLALIIFLLPQSDRFIDDYLGEEDS